MAEIHPPVLTDLLKPNRGPVIEEVRRVEQLWVNASSLVEDVRHLVDRGHAVMQPLTAACSVTGKAACRVIASGRGTCSR